MGAEAGSHGDGSSPRVYQRRRPPTEEPASVPPPVPSPAPATTRAKRPPTPMERGVLQAARELLEVSSQQLSAKGNWYAVRRVSGTVSLHGRDEPVMVIINVISKTRLS